MHRALLNNVFCLHNYILYGQQSSFQQQTCHAFLYNCGLNAGIYKLTGEEVKIREKKADILQIRSEFRDNGPGTQSLEIAREMKRRGHNTIFASSGGVLAEEIKKEFRHIDIPTLAVNKRTLSQQ